MKKIKRVTVVEGNPSEVRNEILLKKNNATGKIDLLKRDSSGILKSIVDNMGNNVDFLVYPEKGPIYLNDPITGEKGEFMLAMDNLSNAVMSSETLVQPCDEVMETVVELTEQMQHDIDTIAAYLPSTNNDDYMFKSPNIVNVSGVITIDPEDPSNKSICVCVQNAIFAITFPSSLR